MELQVSCASSCGRNLRLRCRGLSGSSRSALPSFLTLAADVLLVAVLATSVSSAIIRVKWDSPNDGPGNDWNHAYTTITAAIAASAADDEIWVAGDSAHPYSESISPKSGAGMYGGFAGTETARSERNWKTNVTIIDGAGGTVVTVPGGTATVLDGFTLRNGSSGVSCNNSGVSPSITNNIISGNGVGIYCVGAPSITNNIISGNEIGINCFYSASITNNTFYGNAGNAIYCYYSSPSITNNIVAFNGVGVNTGGTSSTPVLKNNCVYNPSGTNYAGLAAGAGDISADPKFVDRLAGNLHLQASSLCIGAGLNSAVLPGAVDMDGEPRILPVGGTVDIGADEFTQSIVYLTVAQAKALPDGSGVCITGQSPLVTTAAFPSQQAYYVECPNQSSGIRCSGGVLLTPGQTGVLQGVMGTTADGERVLTQAAVVNGTLGSAEIPNAVYMNCRWVGGSAFGLQAGMLGGHGLNTIGLLISAAGQTTFIDPGSQFFTISDGSDVVDIDGHPGVRVWAPGIFPPGLKVGDFVTVTGISSCTKSGSDLYPKVIVRSVEDIVKHTP